MCLVATQTVYLRKLVYLVSFKTIPTSFEVLKHRSDKAQPSPKDLYVLRSYSILTFGCILDETLNTFEE